MRANNDLGIGQDTPDFGVSTPANKVPTREGNPDWPNGSEYVDGQYNDGSANGNYADFAATSTSSAA